MVALGSIQLGALIKKSIARVSTSGGPEPVVTTQSSLAAPNALFNIPTPHLKCAMSMAALIVPTAAVHAELALATTILLSVIARVQHREIVVAERQLSQDSGLVISHSVNVNAGTNGPAKTVTISKTAVCAPGRIREIIARSACSAAILIHNVMVTAV